MKKKKNQTYKQLLELPASRQTDPEPLTHRHTLRTHSGYSPLTSIGCRGHTSCRGALHAPGMSRQVSPSHAMAETVSPTLPADGTGRPCWHPGVLSRPVTPARAVGPVLRPGEPPPGKALIQTFPACVTCLRHHRSPGRDPPSHGGRRGTGERVTGPGSRRGPLWAAGEPVEAALSSSGAVLIR